MALDAAVKFFDEPRVCGACGSSNSTKVCGGCREQVYCSLECQRDHWREHQTQCRKKFPVRRWPAASFGEVGGAAPDASSGDKKKKKTAAEPTAKLSLDYSKSEDREPSSEEIDRVIGDIIGLSKEERDTVVDKLNAVCPEAIKRRDKSFPEIAYDAMDNRTFHAFKAAVEDYLPVELLELDLPQGVDTYSVQILRNCCVYSHGLFIEAEVPERFDLLVHGVREYARGSLSAEDLSAWLQGVYDFTRDDVLLKDIIDCMRRAYPDSQRAEYSRAIAEAKVRVEAEVKARAATEAARPPKPLTGAAALLETLDKFKAKNGGVDDPYYAAMRSALEELEIEEREEGS